MKGGNPTYREFEKQRQQLGITFNEWFDEVYRQGGAGNPAYATRKYQEAKVALTTYEKAHPDFTKQYKDKIAKQRELKNAGVHK
jgi:hypothetical protein